MTYGSFPYGSAPYGGLANLLGNWTPDLQIKLYYKNVLESASQIVVTSENTSFPRYRLYDRALGLLFKGASAPSQFNIIIDLGEAYSYPMIDTIILGSYHNLSGRTLRVYYHDGSNYIQATAWIAQPGTNKRSFIIQGYRYWLFVIENSTSPPEIGELFLTKEYVFQTNPIMGAGEKWRRNIFSEELESGVDTEVKRGERKRVRTYDLRDMRHEQKNDFETWDALCEGVKPFWVQDHNGALIYMKTLNDLEFKYDGEDPDPYYSCHLELREVLGVTV